VSIAFIALEWILIMLHLLTTTAGFPFFLLILSYAENGTIHACTNREDSKSLQKKLLTCLVQFIVIIVSYSISPSPILLSWVSPPLSPVVLSPDFSLIKTGQYLGEIFPPNLFYSPLLSFPSYSGFSSCLDAFYLIWTRCLLPIYLPNVFQRSNEHHSPHRRNANRLCTFE
jgi:hypothetical protein